MFAMFLRMAEAHRESQPVIRVSFDRGTLLLEGEGVSEVHAVPGVLLDPRVGRVRAPAHAWGHLRRVLRERGLAIEDHVSQENLGASRVSMPELRGYQRQAIAAWELGGRRGVVALPTGSGKTRVAIAAMALTGASTLVVVPTRVLLEQWRSALFRETVGPIGQLGDGQRQLESITVSTFESALRTMDRFGACFDLLVVDEAHHFCGGGARSEALEMCSAIDRLGLTATPPEAAMGKRELERVVGPTVFRRSVREMAGTHLAAFEHLTTQLELTAAERREYEARYTPFQAAYRQLRRAGLAPDWSSFMQVISATPQGRKALSGYHAARRLVAVAKRKLEAVGHLLERHADEPVLVFCASNAAAYSISRRYCIAAVTADIKKRERERVLARFREGTIRAIVSSRVLNEGVDIPDARVGIVAGGVHGTREHVQRVGRLLRPRPGKTAVVHELVVRDTFEVGQATKRRRGLAA